jgi:hypothetical protein
MQYGTYLCTRWCSWFRHCAKSFDFLLTKSFRAHYGPEVHSVSNRNDYQWYLLEGGRVKAALHRADNSVTFMCPLCKNSGSPIPQGPNDLFRADVGIAVARIAIEPTKLLNGSLLNRASNGNEYITQLCLQTYLYKRP